MDEILQRLKTARKDANLTQKKTDVLMGKRPMYTFDIERGKKALQCEDIKEYCKLYGIFPNYLLGISKLDSKAIKRNKLADSRILHKIAVIEQTIENLTDVLKSSLKELNKLKSKL